MSKCPLCGFNYLKEKEFGLYYMCNSCKAIFDYNNKFLAYDPLDNIADFIDLVRDQIKIVKRSSEEINQIDWALLKNLVEVHIYTNSPREPIPNDVKDFVLGRDESKCRVCGEDKNLELHHINPASNNVEDIITLCYICHRAVHHFLSLINKEKIKENTLKGMNAIKEDNEDKTKMEQYNIGRPPRGYTSENGKLRPLTEEEKQQRLKEKLKEHGYYGGDGDA